MQVLSERNVCKAEVERDGAGVRERAQEGGVGVGAIEGAGRKVAKVAVPQNGQLCLAREDGSRLQAHAVRGKHVVVIPMDEDTATRPYGGNIALLTDAQRNAVAQLHDDHRQAFCPSPRPGGLESLAVILAINFGVNGQVIRVSQGLDQLPRLAVVDEDRLKVGVVLPRDQIKGEPRECNTPARWDGHRDEVIGVGGQITTALLELEPCDVGVVEAPPLRRLRAALRAREDCRQRKHGRLHRQNARLQNEVIFFQCAGRRFASS